jgi:hypothetical protein
MNEKRPLPPLPDVPLYIDTGLFSGGHLQGIAVDPDKRFIYYSFTTRFVKARLDGSVVGSVRGLTGHLGCISFNPEDGRVYGSVEYKHDAIGRGRMKSTGHVLADEDAFYCAIFDVDRIDRPDMDAEKDGVMTAVWLPDVVEDYSGTGEDGKPHRFACSGIDGTGFGPDFGAPEGSPLMLFIAYGVYGDNDRRDNDHQVLLRFDWRRFGEVARPLSQDAPHHSGLRCDAKLFAFTGNTTWGIQNLEYDAWTGCWIAAVYKGGKPGFGNPPLFFIDGSAAPRDVPLEGLEDHGPLPLLTLAPTGSADARGIPQCGWPRGSTGVYSFGNGYYYFAYARTVRTPEGERLNRADIRLCAYDGELPDRFFLAGGAGPAEGF